MYAYTFLPYRVSSGMRSFGHTIFYPEHRLLYIYFRIYIVCESIASTYCNTNYGFLSASNILSMYCSTTTYTRNRFKHLCPIVFCVHTGDINAQHTQTHKIDMAVEIQQSHGMRFLACIFRIYFDIRFFISK